MKKVLMVAIAATAWMTMATTANAFSTTRCEACHSIDGVKVGPGWKEVVAKYGDEATLAKVFESGFAVQDRKIAGTEPKWASKAVLMTMQYRHLIKGHDKAAAHALFETVKHGKFGDY